MEETPIVVDTNIILSSAIKPGGVTHTRILMLLLDPSKILYIPGYLVEEVESKIE